MTPQEKAKQLIFDMEQRIEQRCNQSSREAHYEAAKKCALVAVGEFISTAEQDWDAFVVTLQYWEQVKTEIEKL